MFNPRRYVVAMAVWVVALAGCIPAMNFAMDPLGYAKAAGWRAAQPTPEELILASSGAWPVPHGHPEAKILNVSSYRPTTAIFGSSTVWSNIDPGYPPLAADGRRPFNFGLLGVTIREMLGAFEHVVALQPPKRVVVGLEFYMFDAAKLSSPGFFDLPLAQRPSYRTDLRWFVGRRLLSADYTTEAAVMFWKRAARRLASWFVADVQAAGAEAQGAAARETFLRLMLDADRIMITTLYPPPGHTFRFVDDQGWSSLDAVRRMVAIARRHDIDLHLYISPNHARAFEAIRLMGWWPAFEAWERGLVRILDEDAKGHPNRQPVPLWDFCCYNSVTIDPIQESPTAAAGFRYFGDTVHFKTEVGDMLMDRMFATEASHKLPPDFGVRLTAQNIERHLAEIEGGHSAYLAANRQDVSDLAAMLQTMGRLTAPATEALK